MPSSTTRNTLFILVLILALSACASDPAQSAEEAPADEAEAPLVEDQPEATEEEAPAATYNPCEMLTLAEIEAVAFRDYPVGQPNPGTDTPFSLDEALSCRWEIGNPDSQFHERLSLFIMTLNGADANAAYEKNIGRLNGAEERPGIGTRAAYQDRSGYLVVLDGDFLFLLRADLLNGDGIEARLTELAQLLIARK